MRYFFHIAYDGSKYSGWQWQPNSFSVQEAIEQKLAKIFKEKVTVYGCGRTDKGVHAAQYFFHLTLNSVPDFEIEFVVRQHLPKSIVLFEVFQVDETQHCRYDAISRSYDYFLHTKADPFLDKYSTLFNYEKLNVSAMQQAAQMICRYQDFRGFCLQPESHNHTRCMVSNSRLYSDKEQHRLRFSITGNRFLKGMNRILIGALLKIGREQLILTAFEEYLRNPKAMPNIKIAPPNGLYLSRVEYPTISRENKSQLYSFLKSDLS